MTLSRRQLLKLALPVGVLAAARREVLLGETTALPPMRTITRGPRHHWFGYYDKLQFDPTVRFCLGNQVDLEHRSPTAADRIGVGMVSHFIWSDPNHILAWTTHPSAGDAFYLLEDREGGDITPIGADVLERDGHCLYLPGADWILSDTYPQGSDRLQEVYLYHIAQGRRVSLGKFHSPPEYSGEWRCDTHPRFSPDQRWICIDSPHGGEGRQMHLIDIRGIVADRSAEPSTSS